MRVQGRLTEWNDDRGFGFITPLSGEPKVFVHVSEFPRSQRRPIMLDLVSFVLARDERGRMQAHDITYLAPTRSRADRAKSAPRVGTLPALLFTLAFLGVLVVGVAAHQLPWVVPLIYAVLSALTFLAYGLDKRAAERHEWRTAEARLHLFSLLGGWPGALVAQPFFRHKTVKQPFVTVFWLTVLGNLGVLVWVFTLV